MIRLLDLAARDRRAITIGLLVIAPAILWTFALAPYLAAVERMREQLIAERELLRRERELLLVADRYPAALDAAAGRLMDLAPRLFGGENAGVGSAMLAQHLQAAARPHRVLLTRLEPAAPTEVGTGLLGLPLDVRGETDLEGLLSMTSSLEEGKLVRIEDLRISGVRSGAVGAGGGEDAQVLSFRFRALGFMLTAPEEAPGSEPRRKAEARVDAEDRVDADPAAGGIR